MKKKIKLEDIRPDDELYTVEDEYFETLSNRISNKIERQKSRNFQTVLNGIWEIKTVRYGISTAFLVVFGMFFGYYFQSPNSIQKTENQLFTEVSSEALSSYLMQEELEEELLIQYYAENSTEAYSDFSEFSAETLEEQVDEVELEEYF